MRTKLMLFVCCAVLLCGCTQPSEGALRTPEATHAPAVPDETPAPEGLEAILMSHAWQDVYDDSFWLEFDLREGTMTENNRALESNTTYRITIDNEKSVFLAENGSEKKSLPFRLEEGLLTVDFGEPIGEILYQAVEKAP